MLHSGMHHLNVDDTDHTSRAAESCQSSQATMALQSPYVEAPQSPISWCIIISI
ncbi:hypothetical protein HanPSC8_Chr10g0438181 [Helianthus annuus]|nr:hypothetical protein HanPSC8_Chr10g0438181 [Helianthus annuus]